MDAKLRENQGDLDDDLSRRDLDVDLREHQGDPDADLRNIKERSRC